MHEMKENVLNEILNWSVSLPAWQRDALRRLFTKGKVDEPDLQALTNLCKSPHGLLEVQTPFPLTSEDIGIGNEANAAVTLTSVTHHFGVNALSPEQTLSFGPNLTVVYGQNAAGKSGYSRILKKACRCRAGEEILGNVLVEGAPPKGKATLKFRMGDTEKVVAWSPDAPCAPELGAISVFDSQSAPVYLQDKTDVAFRPFSLDVFDKLSSICSEIKKRLESEQRNISTAAPGLPVVDAKTKAGAILANITSLTKSEDVKALATLSAGDRTRLDWLLARQRDLLSVDPKKRASELDGVAKRIGVVAAHIDALASLLAEPAMKRLENAKRTRDVASEALARLRSTVLTPDLLPKTGEAAWRTMWKAASDFAREAFPGKDFPAVSHEDKCVLCQQTLDASAVVRFDHFKELVESTAQSESVAAEHNYEIALKAIVGATIEREDVRLTIEELRTEDEALAGKIQSFLTQSSKAQSAVVEAAASRIPAPSMLVDSGLGDEVRLFAKQIGDRAIELRRESHVLSEREASELGELKARVLLNEHLQVVLDEIERKKRIAAFSQAIDDTSTQAITRKSTELTKRLITERLSGQFQEELAKLGFDHLSVEIRSAGGSRGTLYHKLVFRNAPGVSVVNVLSEGESRTLSLASFLTELSTAPSASAIIFDDPVSSLDHLWRERIGKRLVQEAQDRQVIVFTHDLLFLKVLMEEAEKRSVSIQHQYVRNGVAGSGISSPDLPWVAMGTTARIGVLKQRWQAAEKRSREGDIEVYEKDARDIYGMLRETWEHATGEVLLGDVIERYRPSIETKKAKVLHDITPTDCAALEAGMTESSKWIRGHDHPAANGSPFPSPTELKKHIDDLDTWVAQIRKRRSAKK